ncbi:MAG TPA: spermidine synthase [Caulobacteraceae bacterium]|jgi:spermidine synthase|nr:spermidine synthase [Caulobacteraceae bacterium]
MTPWIELDTATMPDGGGTLRLMRRGTEFSIMSGPIELMNSRLSGSEEALAALACARIEARPKSHVLIGGYGMGFTLRAALADLGPDARVTVAELVPAVVAWAREPMAAMTGDGLADPRTTVHLGDVGALIASGRAAYDAILLDVDNGPEGLTRRENDRLYSLAGLAAARRALKPGGVLSVWSSSPNAVFAERLAGAGYAVEEVKVRARPGKGKARHVIWIGTTPA